MTREDYRRLVADRADLFDNPDGASIELLLDERDIRDAERYMAEQLREQRLPESWAKVGIAFRDQYMCVLRDAVRFASGTLGTYIRTIPARPEVPGVVILPILESSVVLVRHFRHATRQWHLEIPRGFGTEGSNPEDDARRELAEEVSGVCRRLVSMGPVHLDTGRSGGQDMLFYAELESLGAHDVDEGIDTVLQVPLEEFDRMVASATITDGFTLAAYARARAGGLIAV